MTAWMDFYPQVCYVCITYMLFARHLSHPHVTNDCMLVCALNRDLL